MVCFDLREGAAPSRRERGQGMAAGCILNWTRESKMEIPAESWRPLP